MFRLLISKSYRIFWICVLFFVLFSISLGSRLDATPANVETYDQLVSAIRAARAASRERIEQAVDREKIREAWETGKLIHEHILLHKERADYGKRVLVRLAGDLEMSETELGYMLQFVHTYPISPPAGKLSWSHYRELLSINDEKERSEVTKKAENEGWGRDRVREEVRRRTLAGASSPETEQLVVSKPGKVGTYRVVKAVVGPLTGQLVLDLGFSNYFQPEKISKFKEGDIVVLEKGKLKKIEEELQRRTAPTLSTDAAVVAQQAQLFTYNVYVTQVIDGDTFRAVVDLGFKFSTVQTLRLRGLDAPEIESKEGQEAKAFLAKQLAKNHGAILIKTVKSDKYDRYLADVWADGRYVNQELIDQDLAVRVSE